MNLDGDYAVSVAGNKQVNEDLGVILRRVRNARRFSVRHLGSLIEISPSTVSRLEAGTRNAEKDVVKKWMAACGASDKDLQDALELVEKSRQSPWVAITMPDHRRQAAALLAAEESAVEIVAWSAEVVPGLLQDDDYTVALMRSAGMSPTLIKRQLEHRQRRKKVVEPPTNVKYKALIGEGALIRRIGGRPVLKNQLSSLLAASRLPHIDLHVVPLDTDWHPGLDGSFVLIRGEQRALVHAAISGSALIFDRPLDIENFERAVEGVLNIAMTPADSAEVIRRRLENC